VADEGDNVHSDVGAIFGNGDVPNVLIGNAGTNGLTGGRLDDRLDGLGGRDFLFAGDGADTLVPGAGDDYVIADAGDDLVDARDGEAEQFLDCGPGDDTVWADPQDVVVNCEHVLAGP
jgi:Ca2+-binding RTX toxin-like protein